MYALCACAESAATWRRRTQRSTWAYDGIWYTEQSHVGQTLWREEKWQNKYHKSFSQCRRTWCKQEPHPPGGSIGSPRTDCCPQCQCWLESATHQCAQEPKSSAGWCQSDWSAAFAQASDSDAPLLLGQWTWMSISKLINLMRSDLKQVVVLMFTYVKTISHCI